MPRESEALSMRPKPKSSALNAKPTLSPKKSRTLNTRKRPSRPKQSSQQKPIRRIVYRDLKPENARSLRGRRRRCHLLFAGVEDLPSFFASFLISAQLMSPSRRPDRFYLTLMDIRKSSTSAVLSDLVAAAPRSLFFHSRKPPRVARMEV